MVNTTTIPSARPRGATPPAVSRRALIAGTAATAVATAAPGASGTPPDHPDAALLAAWDGFVAAHRAFDRACRLMVNGGTDADHEPYIRAINAHRDIIEGTEARTMAGIAVQLRHLFMARMECMDSFQAVVHGRPVSDDLAARLDEDDRDWMLWTMVRAANRAGGQS